MKPKFETIHIYGGQTLSHQFLFVDGDGNAVPLGSYEARMQAREEVSSPEPRLDLSTDDGTIAVDDTGLLTLNLTAEATAALVAGVYDTQTWVFDLELVSPGATPVVRKPLTGVIIVHPEITR